MIPSKKTMPAVICCLILIQSTVFAQTAPASSSMSNAFPFGAEQATLVNKANVKYEEYQSICRKEKNPDVRFNPETGQKRILLLEEKLKSDPENPTIITAYLKELINQKKVRELDKAKSKYSAKLSHIDELMVNTEFDIQNKSYTAAILKLEKFLKTDPSSTKVLLKLAEVYKLKENYLDSRDIYLDLIKTNKSLDFSRELCENLVLDSLHSEAEAQCFKAIQKYPSDYASHIYLGISYREQQLYDKASSEFEASLKVQPSEFAYSCLGEIRKLQKKGDESAAFFKQALDLETNSFRANLGLAQLLLDEKKIPEALKYFETACRINPSDLAAFNNAFRMLSEQKSNYSGKFLQAIQKCKTN